MAIKEGLFHDPDYYGCLNLTAINNKIDLNEKIASSSDSFKVQKGLCRKPKRQFSSCSWRQLAAKRLRIWPGMWSSLDFTLKVLLTPSSILRK